MLNNTAKTASFSLEVGRMPGRELPFSLSNLVKSVTNNKHDQHAHEPAYCRFM